MCRCNAMHLLTISRTNLHVCRFSSALIGTQNTLYWYYYMTYIIGVPGNSISEPIQVIILWYTRCPFHVLLLLLALLYTVWMDIEIRVVICYMEPTSPPLYQTLFRVLPFDGGDTNNRFLTGQPIRFESVVTIS